MFEDLPTWLGGDDPKTPLPGTRIAVLTENAPLEADPSLADIPVTIPLPRANGNWRQASGGPHGMTGNLQLSGYTHHDSARIGEGNGWEQPLYPSPIAAEGVVYAMDAKGYITAHDATDITHIRWTARDLVGEDEPDLLGGGLAYEDRRIYATSGRGVVAAFDAASGKMLWKQSLGVPLRAAPKIGDHRVYALSVDNQLFALGVDTGATLWSHRGMNENAGFLAAISPAVTDSAVIAPYSSGELHALDSGSGQEIWRDSLLRTHRTNATAGFASIGGSPVVADDIVYASGSGGLSMALSLSGGQRVWEQDIAALNMPWIADSYVYLLTAGNQLAALRREDGRVRWAVQLPRFKDEKKSRHPLVWRGPVLAGGQLLVTGAHGQMLALSPADGKLIATVEIPENVTDAPIVAGGRLYMLTQDARLHVLY